MSTIKNVGSNRFSESFIGSYLPAFSQSFQANEDRLAQEAEREAAKRQETEANAEAQRRRAQIALGVIEAQGLDAGAFDQVSRGLELAGIEDLNEALTFFTEKVRIAPNFDRDVGLEMQGLGVASPNGPTDIRPGTTTAPPEITGYSLEQIPEEEDWRDLGSVTYNNYRGLAAAARNAGHEDTARQIEEVGQQYAADRLRRAEAVGGSSRDDLVADLVAAMRSGNVDDIQAARDALELKEEINRLTQTPVNLFDTQTGEFIQAYPDLDFDSPTLSRGWVGLSGDDHFVGDRYTQVSDEQMESIRSQIRSLNTQTAEVRDRFMSTSEMLDIGFEALQIANSNPASLTAVGSVAAFADSINQDVTAFVELVKTNTMTPEQAAEQIANRQPAIPLPENVRTLARDNQLLRSKLLLLTYKSAAALGQTGQGLSNKDFENVGNILRASNNAETFQRALLSFINTQVNSVTSSEQVTQYAGQIQGIKAELGALPDFAGDIIPSFDAFANSTDRSPGFRSMYSLMRPGPQRDISRSQSTTLDAQTIRGNNMLRELGVSNGATQEVEGNVVRITDGNSVIQMGIPREDQAAAVRSENSLAPDTPLRLILKDGEVFYMDQEGKRYSAGR